MSRKSPIIGAFLGNAFERYDSALFYLLSPFFATLFFPNQDPTCALIFAYGMIPLGKLARPLGALFFGKIGDQKSRKKSLSLSLFGMCAVTVGMTCIPTYTQAGVFAPCFLAAGRILHNFFAAGESTGGALYLIERTEEKRHNMISSLHGSSTVIGILFASLGVFLVGAFDQTVYGWRFLYAIGSLIGLIGWIVRKGDDELPFCKKEAREAFFPLLWEHRKTACLIAVVSGFSYANYSFSLVMINGFVPLISDVTTTQMMGLNTLLLVGDFFLLPLFGWLSSRWSREKVMIAAAFSVIVTAMPLFSLLPGSSLLLISLVRFWFVLLGVAFSATFYIWAANLLPPSCRYTLIAFSYAIGSQLFGAPSAAISLWLFHQTGLVSSVAWYWMALGSLTSCLMINSYLKQKNPLAIKRESSTNAILNLGKS